MYIFVGKNSSLTEADVTAILAATEGTKERVIMHESEVLVRARNEAKKCESVRMGARKGAAIGGKKEELLRKAATLYAQIGDLEKYCSILVDLGDWTEAIAVAPGMLFFDIVICKEIFIYVHICMYMHGNI